MAKNVGIKPGTVALLALAGIGVIGVAAFLIPAIQQAQAKAAYQGAMCTYFNAICQSAPTSSTCITLKAQYGC